MPRTRSPNFPSISLERAVELAGRLYSHAQRHPMPVEAIVKDVWGMSPTGSTAKQAIGALRGFGLIEVEGARDKRKAHIAGDAAKILEDHSERQELLQAAALRPKVHEAVWRNCGGKDGLAPDQTVQHFLLFDHDPPFNKAVIPAFIKQFRETLSFARVSFGDIMDDQDDEEDAGDEGKQAPTPDAMRGQPRPKPAPRGEAQAGMNQDVFTLSEGEVVLKWPSRLTPESFEDFKDWLRLIERKASRSVMPDKLDEDKTDNPE